MRRTRTLAMVVGLGTVLSVAAPGAAEVNVNINVGVPPPPPPPPIVVSEPPPLVVVPRTQVYYAPSLPYNFFYYGGRYYTFHESGWYWSGSVHGPWGFIEVGRVPRPVLAVPISYYKVRPAEWEGHKHHGPPPWAPAHGYRGHHGHGHHDD